MEEGNRRPEVSQMISVFLYATVVLIWGSTWLAVKYQLGPVSPEVSVAYRMGSAALMLFFLGFIKQLPFKYGLPVHLMMMLQGALLFSLNFFLFYLAAESLVTGLIAVIFSTASALTVVLNCLLARRLPSIQLALGAMLGVLGVGLIFSGEILNSQTTVGYGLLYSIGGTLCFSLGTIVSARIRTPGQSTLVNIAWAMSYGTGLLCFLALVRGNVFNFDFSKTYIISLAYLSVFGSVIAFTAYFALLKHIRTEQAAYATVLFPVVALTLSTLFENYQWTATAGIGVFITLLGNILINWRST